MLIDEAYYEFCGVTALPLLRRYPNLFVSRTFSKVYGLAALRIGCLFSQAANVQYLRKAQSPYSVNILAAIAARAAVRDTAYVANFVRQALAARDLLYAGFDQRGIRYLRSQANFVLFRAGERPSHSRLPARSWRPGARQKLRNPRLCAGHRRNAAAGRALSRGSRGNLAMPDAAVHTGLRHGRRAGGRHRMLPRSDRPDGARTSPGTTVARERIQEYKNRGGFNNDWPLSQQICRDFGVEVDYERWWSTSARSSWATGTMA